MKYFQLSVGGRGEVHTNSHIMLDYTQLLYLEITVPNQRGDLIFKNHSNRVKFSTEKEMGKMEK